MTRLVLVLIAAVLLAGPAAAAADYAAMVAKLKGGGVTVDYRALRDAYAESPGYSPYGGAFDEPRAEMRTAFNASDCTKALVHAQKVLDLLYIDVMSHLLSARCFENAKNQAKTDFHRKVARGLMDSIMASGDGKSPKTAFVVVRIDEEYDVLSTLRYRLTNQSLDSADGHVFDRIEAHGASGEKVTLYFQIDRPMAWMSRKMAK